MKVNCPEHMGLIYIDLQFRNERDVLIRKVVECPVCDDEVIIEGRFDIDSEGLAIPVEELSGASR
jgi:hypothetical protein